MYVSDILESYLTMIKIVLIGSSFGSSANLAKYIYNL